MNQIDLPDYRRSRQRLPPDSGDSSRDLSPSRRMQPGQDLLSAHDEVVALEDINFAVHRREFLCVIGPSGCGKSTLIRVLAGLETPTKEKS